MTKTWPMAGSGAGPAACAAAGSNRAAAVMSACAIRGIMACPSKTESGAAGQTLGRPFRLQLIEDLEDARILGQADPGKFRAREDVRAGRQRGRLVERADADEAHDFAAAIITPQRGLAFGAARDDVRAAGIGGRGDIFGLALYGDPIGFDERVDDEGGAGLALAILAMAAVHEHRRGGEGVTDGAAGAAAREGFCFGHGGSRAENVATLSTGLGSVATAQPDDFVR